jgi:YVTN family beta-propeller protein
VLRAPPTGSRRGLTTFRTGPVRLVATVVAGAAILASCSGGGGSNGSINANKHPTTTVTAAATTVAPTTTTAPAATNVYQYTQAGMLSPSVQGDPSRVYVPNGGSNSVSVIDPATYQVINTFSVGALPQHVVPAYDLSTLYVNNNQGNSLTPIDPKTSLPGASIPVNDPYNLYFSPDGKYAIVMAERESQVDIRDPHTWKLIKSIPIAHRGVNHADFSADGSTMVASCEFTGWVVKINMATLTVVGEANLGGQPIDVKLSPDGTVMYVANQSRDGVSILDPNNMTELGFIPTGAGAHGLYVSRDTTKLYVTNRKAGSVSVIDFATRQVVGTWTIPGGGSPDMGGVSADGKEFWVTGRYNSVVYVFDTTTGQLTHKIPVGSGPHGLAIFPQPGRYSLGHTGVYR